MKEICWVCEAEWKVCIKNLYSFICLITVFITLYYNIFSVLHALNEDSERYAEEKERTLRSQAIQEILTTEVTYLQQLEILTEVHFNACLIMKLLKHYSSCFSSFLYNLLLKENYWIIHYLSLYWKT